MKQSWKLELSQKQSRKPELSQKQSSEVSPATFILDVYFRDSFWNLDSSATCNSFSQRKKQTKGGSKEHKQIKFKNPKNVITFFPK